MSIRRKFWQSDKITNRIYLWLWHPFDQLLGIKKTGIAEWCTLFSNVSLHSSSSKNFSRVFKLKIRFAIFFFNNFFCWQRTLWATKCVQMSNKCQTTPCLNNRKTKNSNPIFKSWSTTAWWPTLWATTKLKIIFNYLWYYLYFMA